MDVLVNAATRLVSRLFMNCFVRITFQIRVFSQKVTNLFFSLINWE